MAHSVRQGDSKLLYIYDPLSKSNYLIDTGAEVSVLPATNSQRMLPALCHLYAANGSKIPVYKKLTQKLSLHLRRSFEWTFYVAAISQPILGADFLTHFDLLVDIKNRKIHDSLTKLSTVAQIQLTTSMSLSVVNEETKFTSILKEFPSLTQPQLATNEVKHHVTHHITTVGPPTFSKPRRLAPERYRLAKEEFETLMKQGIIRPSSSNWSSALHIVAKKDGGIRPCGDYRSVNSRTVMDRYPIPNIQEFSSQLSDSKIFSKIDLVKAFHQIPVHPDDIPKTAITTPFGMYEYVRMPFGLKNAAQTFQRFIDEVLRGLPFCFAYIDDLLIASKDENSHLQHMKEVFTRLQNYGIQINVEKSMFGVYSVDFLGHTVSSTGITPLQAKCLAVQQFPKPSTQRQLKEYLGMINYYNRFIPNCSDLLQPLYSMLKPSKKGQSIKLTWTQEAEKAFLNSKNILINGTTLSFPVSEAETSISTDASNIGTGAVLQQFIDSAWKPIAFFSQKFNNAESKYSTFDRELLAIYKAIKRFRYFIEGRKFHVYTDHKPLTTTFANNKNSYSPRQFRHIDYISQFSTDIRYIKGSENLTADALSRNIATISSSNIDYVAIAKDQEIDEELQKLKMNSSLQLKMISIPGSEIQLYADISTNNIRPYIPEKYRYQIFQQMHNLSHPGIRASQKLISSKFIWSNINKDIRNWTRNCLKCQSSKINRHTKSPVGKFPPTSSRFEHVHVDLVGPFPSSNGYRYIFTCVDRFTRWPEAIPIKDIDTETVAKAFIETWISRYGVPVSITSDRGSQFESTLFSKILSVLGIQRFRTASYHPQANGLVERFHRQLKSSLIATIKDRNEWTTSLPIVLLGIRTSLKTDIGHSSAELLYGSTLRLPGEFLDSTSYSNTTDINDFAKQLQQYMSQLRPTEPRTSQARSFVSQELSSCTHVFLRVDTIRKSLQAPYEGPYEVIRRTRKNFTINRNGTTTNVSIDRVKPAYILKETLSTLQPQTSNPTKPKKSVSFLIPRH